MYELSSDEMQAVRDSWKRLVMEFSLKNLTFRII